MWRQIGYCSYFLVFRQNQLWLGSRVTPLLVEKLVCVSAIHSVETLKVVDIVCSEFGTEKDTSMCTEKNAKKEIGKFNLKAKHVKFTDFTQQEIIKYS